MKTFGALRLDKTTTHAATACALDGSTAYSYAMPALLKGKALSENVKEQPVSYRSIFLIVRRIEALSSGRKRMVCTGASPIGVGIDSLRLARTFNSAEVLIKALGADEMWKFACAAGNPKARPRSILTWVDGQSFQSAWLVPPPVSEIESLMTDLRSFVAHQIAKADCAELAQTVLYQIIHIHPLADGNGRFARLWISCLSLLRGDLSGFAIALLLLQDRRIFGRAWAGDAVADEQLCSSVACLMQALENIHACATSTVSLYPESKAWQLLVNSTLCFGNFSTQTIQALDHCGHTLATKRAEAAGRQLAAHNDQYGECPISKLESLITQLVMETSPDRNNKERQADEDKEFNAAHKPDHTINPVNDMHNPAIH